MNKKQVNAFIRVLDNDDRRPFLRYAYFVKVNKKIYLVGTNMYCAVALEVDHSFDDKVNKAIHINEFLIWKALNKKQGTKLNISDLEICEVESKKCVIDYKKLVADNIKSHESSTEPTSTLSVNPKFIRYMEDINDGNLKWYLHGSAKPMTAVSHNGLFIVLPITC